MKIKLSTKIISLVFIALLPACNDYGNGFSDPYNDPYTNDPYRNSYGNSYGNDDYYRNQREKRDIDRERDRLDRERRDLEREKDRQNSYRPPVYNPPVQQQPRAESCPSGFSPSENKCSSEERKRGCKDMRLPGGLGCVSR